MIEADAVEYEGCENEEIMQEEQIESQNKARN